LGSTAPEHEVGYVPAGEELVAVVEHDGATVRLEPSSPLTKPEYVAVIVGTVAPSLIVPELAVMVSIGRVMAVTFRLAVALIDPSVPVTVCDPATVALQLVPVHEPSGAMVKVVAPVTSPRELPYWSEPDAV